MAGLDGLERLAPLRDLSPAGRRLLEQGLERHACAPAATLLRKGEPVSGAYLVVSGRLRVYALSARGSEATLYFIDPGETCVLALNCLFNDLRYPAWVQAEGATEVAVLPGPLYRRLFQGEPGIQDLTVRALSSVVFRLMGELEQIHGSQQIQRLANFILLHAGADGDLAITQQQLAGHLGTSREVVARLMRELVTGGCVATRRGGVRIRDVAALRRVVAPAGV